MNKKISIIIDINWTSEYIILVKYFICFQKMIIESETNQIL